MKINAFFWIGNHRITIIRGIESEALSGAIAQALEILRKARVSVPLREIRFEIEEE